MEVKVTGRTAMKWLNVLEPSTTGSSFAIRSKSISATGASFLCLPPNDKAGRVNQQLPGLSA